MTSPLEIFWIVLAFCVLWVAAFACWALYHIAMIARRIHLVFDEVKVTLGQIELAIHGVREKIEQHANLLDPLVALAGSLLRKRKQKALKGEETTV
ncbi:hypothetical protein HYV72_00460 [Candidatus Uhrbacteria bacterium]|nr:hypothetical protein [Candidatus Uhrbacteria bacterium]